MSTETVSEPISEEILTDHTYDGIQEYDNPLPGWWVFLFWLFIFFAPLYLAFFHLGVEGRTIHDQYGREMAAIFKLKFAKMGDLEPDRATITKYMTDPEGLAFGEVVYKTHCVGCHGSKGEGNVGPNLTDDHWKNVRAIEDIAKVISEGANNGAMPAWKNRLSHINEVVLTAAYIASLRENPVAGKSPEGNPIPAWEQ